jgi:hypothetical protein
MNMNLGELIETLTKLQTLAGPQAETNVDVASLKATVHSRYPGNQAYQFIDDDKPCRGSKFKVWVKSHQDGPVTTEDPNPMHFQPS